MQVSTVSSSARADNAKAAQSTEASAPAKARAAGRPVAAAAKRLFALLLAQLQGAPAVAASPQPELAALSGEEDATGDAAPEASDGTVEVGGGAVGGTDPTVRVETPGQGAGSAIALVGPLVVSLPDLEGVDATANAAPSKAEYEVVSKIQAAQVSPSVGQEASAGQAAPEAADAGTGGPAGRQAPASSARYRVTPRAAAASDDAYSGDVAPGADASGASSRIEIEELPRPQTGDAAGARAGKTAGAAQDGWTSKLGGPEVALTSASAATRPLDQGVVGVPASSLKAYMTQGVEAGRPEAPPPAATTLDGLGDYALRGVRYVVSHGEKTLEVRLVPPSLGEVRVEVTSSDNGLTVRLTSANPAVRDALENHLPALRDALAQDGARVARVTADLANTSSGAFSAQTFAGHAGRDPAEHAGAPPLQAPETSKSLDQEEAPPGPVSRGIQHDGILNLFV